jgi:hypothetical protein
MADNFDNYGMKVRATVDMPSVGDIDKQIRKLEKSISKLQVSGKLDDTSLKALSHQLDTLKATVTTANFSPTALIELTNQVNRALQNIQIDNINIGNVNNQAQQVGQQIGRQVNQGLQQEINNNEQILNSFRESLRSINSLNPTIDMDGSQINNVVRDVENLGLRLESVKESLSTINGRRGSRNVLSVSIEGFDEHGQALSLTRQYNAITGELIRNVNAVSTATQQANTQLENLTAQQIKRQQDLRNQASQIFASGNDQNHDRSIANANNLETLRTRYNAITTAIGEMGSTSKVTFAEQEANVTGLITELKNLIAQYRNEENVRTTIKPDKLAEGINKAQSRWKALDTDIRNSGVSSEKLTEEISTITNLLSRVDSTDNPLNKAEVERVHTALTNAKHELDALVKIDTSNSSLESIRLQAETAKNRLDEFAKKNVGFDSWTRDVDGATIGIKDLKDELDGVKTASDLRVATARVNEFESAFKAANATASKTSDIVEKVNEIQHLSDTGHFKKQVSDITVEYGKLSSVTDELEKDFTELKRLEQVLATPQVDDSNYEKFNTTLEKVKNNIHILTNEQKKSGTYNSSALAEQKKIDSLAESVLKFRDNNTKMSKDLRRQFTGIYDSLIVDTNLTEKQVRELAEEFTNLKLKVREAGQLGQSFGDKMKNAFVKFSEWGFATSIVTEVWQGLKRVYNESLKINDVMTDLAMSTDLTASQMESVVDKYSNLGEKLNATTSEMIASGTEWIKQGQSIADTETLITSAMVLDKVGKLENAQATEYLTSTMKGYKVAVEDTMDIVDKLSAVDMASATNVGGLAEAMSQVANNANLAGVSMDKLLGYIAVIGETTGEGMSSVGTGLNAIFSRMGNIKLARLKDYQNNGEDLNIWGITA